ncbi:MAG TPA: hypothetical protein DCP57_11630 [Gammaproteobacteria bacterium]|mgnify:FL=1|nr:hypothetical protein [Gammaproteobacteria bacterium]
MPSEIGYGPSVNRPQVQTSNKAFAGERVQEAQAAAAKKQVEAEGVEVLLSRRPENSPEVTYENLQSRSSSRAQAAVPQAPAAPQAPVETTQPPASRPTQGT